jgi:hypothetical protein
MEMTILVWLKRSRRYLMINLMGFNQLHLDYCLQDTWLQALRINKVEEPYQASSTLLQISMETLSNPMCQANSSLK